MNKHLKGGFTVETALLIPLLLSVVLIVVYLNIYLYDSVVMQTAACRGAQKVFYNELQDNNAVEGNCAKVVLEEIKASLVFMKDINVEVSVSTKEVSVTVQGRLDVPGIVYLEPLVSDEFWMMKVNWTEERLHAPTIVKSVYHTVELIKKGAEERGL